MKTDTKILGTDDHYFYQEGNLMKTKSPPVSVFSISATIALLCLFAVRAPGQSSPNITAQPTNQTVIAGGTALFTVAVSGTGPFTYQWQFDGTNLPHGVITTVAGKGPEYAPGTGGPPAAGDGGSDINATLDGPNNVAFDTFGNFYISEYLSIRKVDANGIISTVAGNGDYGYSGDGGPATNASLSGTVGVTFDSSGNLYFCDSDNEVIRKVSTNGIITTVVGNGTQGYSGDGGAAISAELNFPQFVVFDTSGNLFFSDSENNVVRKVSTNGIITTVAGNGISAYSGDDGPATNAELALPQGVALDDYGNLFIADSGNSRVRRLGSAGIITTVAGNGTTGYSGDSAEATNAQLNNATGVALDASGNLYIADYGNSRIRQVSPNGIISTVAGNGVGGFSGDDGPAVNANLYYAGGVSVDAAGNLYIADNDNERIRKVEFTGQPTLTLANVTSAESGSYSVVISNAYGSVTSIVAVLTIVAPATIITQPQAVMGEMGGTAIFSVLASGTGPLTYQWQFDGTNLPNGIITTVAGNGPEYAPGTGGPPATGDGGAATNATLDGPNDVAFDAHGNFYISEYLSIRKVDSNGIISTVAGNGNYGYSGDGGAATNATLSSTVGVAFDSSGNLYFCDSGNNVLHLNRGRKWFSRLFRRRGICD